MKIEFLAWAIPVGIALLFIITWVRYTYFQPNDYDFEQWFNNLDRGGRYSFISPEDERLRYAIEATQLYRNAHTRKVRLASSFSNGTAEFWVFGHHRAFMFTFNKNEAKVFDSKVEAEQYELEFQEYLQSIIGNREEQQRIEREKNTEIPL